MSLESVHFKAGYNFLGLAEEDSRYEDARAVIIPVPYDSTTSYRAGTREGPAAILTASRQVELFDLDLQCEPVVSGVHTLPELEPDMQGPAATIANIESAVRAVIADGKFPVMLGGEHSITTAPVKALKEKYGDTLSVLQLDAHSDLRESYEKTPFSHASVMRRVFDLAKITQVGIRNTCRDEMEFIKKSGHDGIIWASEMTGNDLAWVDRVMKRLSHDVYITIDLDAFDPSIMPAVGTPEPGGMLWYQTLHLLNRVIDEKNVVGFDVVELCPIPGNIASDFMAAKLVFKMLGRIFRKNSWIAEEG
ncbi:MAG: agmatinase [Erysipelotrichia bacterium]|nr:agmatinase [Erysipelotrichia bacterium]